MKGTLLAVLLVACSPTDSGCVTEDTTTDAGEDEALDVTEDTTSTDTAEDTSEDVVVEPDAPPVPCYPPCHECDAAGALGEGPWTGYGDCDVCCDGACVPVSALDCGQCGEACALDEYCGTPAFEPDGFECMAAGSPCACGQGTFRSTTARSLGCVAFDAVELACDGPSGVVTPTTTGAGWTSSEGAEWPAVSWYLETACMGAIIVGEWIDCDHIEGTLIGIIDDGCPCTPSWGPIVLARIVN